MSIIVRDNFIDINGTILTAHVPTLGTIWEISGLTSLPVNFTINSNQLSTAVQFATTAAMVISDIIKESQFVQVTYISKASAVNDTSFMLLVRALGTAGTFSAYVLEIFPLTGNVRILGYNGGIVVYNSGITVVAIPNGAIIKFLVIGTALKVYVDGELKIAKVNGAVTQAGKVGIGFAASFGLTNAYVFDNFIGDDTEVSLSGSFASGRGRPRRTIQAFNPGDGI